MKWAVGRNELDETPSNNLYHTSISKIGRKLKQGRLENINIRSISRILEHTRLIIVAEEYIVDLCGDCIN